MNRKRIQVKVGDVFQIKIDDHRAGYGQVIAKNIGPNPLLIAIFRQVYPLSAPPSIEEVTQSEILFLANSMDAKIWHGHWPVVGNSPPNPERIPFPFYKVGRPGNIYIENYEGEAVRKAAPENCKFFDYRFSVTPMMLENALKAYYGLGMVHFCTKLI
ncbi:immunity 26/phosphotriesterase HocA family protein [Candidatus Poribacteria bacterium]|nr:immunity 26/phosphotriesterase HocA family protein [Candidatus Poribacteria bacterium]